MGHILLDRHAEILAVPFNDYCKSCRCDECSVFQTCLGPKRADAR